MLDTPSNLPVCRRYKDISEKLGGEDEAANAMGKLVRNVASRLAGEKSIAEVSDI